MTSQTEKPFLPWQRGRRKLLQHENSAAQLNFSQAMLKEIDALKIHSEVKCSNKYLRKYLSFWQSQQFLSNSRCCGISGKKTPYFRNFTNRWRWIHLGGSPAAAALLENAQDRNHQTGLVSVTEPKQHGSEKNKMHAPYLLAVDGQVSHGDF